MTHDLIIVSLSSGGCKTASEIAQECCVSPREAQDALIEMDDAGEVLMKNGFYRLAAKAANQLEGHKP